MHPTIAYHVAQERIADLHRQVRNETSALAATGTGAGQAPARRAQDAGPGRPSRSSPLFDPGQIPVSQEAGPFSRPPGQVCPVGCLSREPSRLAL